MGLGGAGADVGCSALRKVLLAAVGTAGTSCCAALCTATAATGLSRGCAPEREGSAQRCGREIILLPGQLRGRCPPRPPSWHGEPCPPVGLPLPDICTHGAQEHSLPAAQPSACLQPAVLRERGPAQGIPVTPHRASPWPHRVSLWLREGRPSGPIESIPTPHTEHPHS